MNAADGWQIRRTGQEVDDGVQQRLNTFIFQGAATQYRHQFQIDGGFANGGDKNIFLNGRFAEVGLHDLIVYIGHAFDQLIPAGLGLVHYVPRNFLEPIGSAETVVIPKDGPHLD